ncbi:DISARM system phospholipase D-like protein DrmC, partial [Candidatus Bipolaricaulota bacterium]|nr:DISARM system phospholipase D-like protein DrmC [Candidatus Bipolaricaulota bacterium]
DDLAPAVAAAARSMPREQLEAAAEAIRSRPRWSSRTAEQLLNAVPAPGWRAHADRINRAWRAAPELPGAGIAAALDAALAVVADERTSRTTIVWTGPSTDHVPLRTTRAVLNTMVARAEHELLLVSYAGFRVEELNDALLKAITDRSVKVTMILETSQDQGGGLTVAAANAFQPLVGKARFYTWAAERRAAEFAQHASLHAKCVIRDRVDALVTSANLTSAAIHDNIELGLRIEGGPIPGILHRHFEALIDEGVLELDHGL